MEIFLDVPMTPKQAQQCEDRCHRIGQTGNVLVQHLVIDGSIDAKMAKLLIDKATVIDQILDGKLPEGIDEAVLTGLLPAA